MKTKAKDKVKPWENISIDEILPYNPKYTKMIILSYIFIAFFIFENTNFLGIQENYLSLITLCVYGILAFALLYLDSDGRPKRMLNMFISITLFFIILGLIINIIMAIVIGGFSFLDIILTEFNSLFILNFILIILNGVLFGVTIVLGPISLFITNHPKLEKYVLLMAVIFNVFIIMDIFFI